MNKEKKDDLNKDKKSSYILFFLLWIFYIFVFFSIYLFFLGFMTRSYFLKLLYPGLLRAISLSLAAFLSAACCCCGVIIFFWVDLSVEDLADATGCEYDSVVDGGGG